MDYPFPSINRSVYPKTFLKDVFLVVDFCEVSFDSVDIDRLNSFFSQFKVVEIDAAKISGGIELKSNDGTIRLRFSLKRIEIILRQPFYKSFEQAEEFINVMIKYMESLSVKEIQKISVSKFNELGFRLQSPDYPIIDIMKDVFSVDLLDKVGIEDGSFNDMVRWEKVVSMDGSAESGTVFYAECGFRRRDLNSQDGSLTLTTRVESAVGNIVVDALLDIARKYNQILDNAFHWCIEKNIIEKMKES